MLPLTMIYLKKGQAGLAVLVALGPHGTSVSWAACPVFELKLEGNEAWCAKHFPRVTPQGKGHAVLGCVEGELTSANYYCQHSFLELVLYIGVLYSIDKLYFL